MRRLGLCFGASRTLGRRSARATWRNVKSRSLFVSRSWLAAPPRLALAVGVAPTNALVPTALSTQESAAQETAAQEAPARAEAQRVTISFADAPVRDVLFTFAEFAGRSIVAGARVDGLVSAEIRDQPWDVALQAVLEAHGLVARETESGIVQVEDARSLFERESIAPLETRTFRVGYASAVEMQDAAAALLSERGRISVGEAANALVVTDVPRVLASVEALVATLDVQAPQVDIAAQIVFVNRTALEDFGITYALRDRRGGQVSGRAPGGADTNGGGEPASPNGQLVPGAAAVSLAGPAVTALGNATQRVPSPMLSLLATLVRGDRTVLAFIEALHSVQLTDVEARPSVRVLDNHTAKIVVGEETPVRVVDAGAQGGGTEEGGSGRSGPVATVDYKETGVILEVTPRVAPSGDVHLELMAERSSADLGPSDVGLIFRRQRAESRVLVKDGETVVIGGLTVEETSESRVGIPILMDIPVLGALFRSRRESLVQRDLIILVTPTVVRSGAPR